MSQRGLTRRNSKRSIRESDSDVENYEKTSQRRRMEDGNPEFTTVMDRLAKLADSNEQIMKKLNDQSDMMGKLDANFDGLRSEMTDLKKGLQSVENRMSVTEDKVNEMERKIESRLNMAQVIRGNRKISNSSKTDQFWKSRRTFLFAPFDPNDESTYQDKVKAFMVNNLGFTQQEVQGSSFESITAERRIRKRSGQAKEVDYAKVVCHKKFDRDRVFGKLSNLPGDGVTTVEMDVPDHLLSKFRRLKSASFKLRKDQMKTTMRYDEENEDIMLMAKKNGGEWKKYVIQKPTIPEEIITLP